MSAISVSFAHSAQTTTEFTYKLTLTCSPQEEVYTRVTIENPAITVLKNSMS